MRVNLLFRLLLAVFLLASAPVRAQFKVIGYMPSWTGDVNSVQYDKLTHINYAFLLPNADGSLRPIENPAKLQSLVATAHARGVKVLISVGGWMNDGNPVEFVSIGNNATYTRNFVTNLVNFATQYNLDGIDIDWEHPTASSANGYANVMQELSTQLRSRGKLLTTAVAGGTWAGSSILDRALNVLDFLNIMAYDDVAPAHSTYNLASQSISYWRGRGVAASKIVLGVPFYGQSGGETYASLLSRGASPNADLFNGIGYNGIPTIKSKTNLAFDQANGIMIWQLGGDAVGANSLLTAINEVVRQRTTVTPPPPPPPTSTGFTIQAESYGAMSGVQVETTSDTGGGQNVGYIDAGDWLAYYNVNFPTSGSYLIEYRIASLSGGTLSSDLNAGTTQLGRVTVPATGGWQTWRTVSQTVNVNAGTYNFGVFAQTGGWNLNWIRISKAGTTASATTSSSAATAGPATAKALPLGVEVYPNPQTAGRALTLHLTNYAGATPLQVRLTDMSGREILSQRVTGSTVELAGNSSLKAGLYLLQVSDGQTKVSKKLVVQ